MALAVNPRVGLVGWRGMVAPGIILHLIKGGVLCVEEADRAKAKLEAHRFKMSFESFRALIEDSRNEHG